MSLEKLEARDIALMKRNHRQIVLGLWAAESFGEGHAASVPQRAVRKLEEDIEAFQAAMHEYGFDRHHARAKAHQLVDYILDRPPGTLAQELGGCAVTLLLLARAAGLSAEECEIREIERVLSKDPAHFRARNEAKNAAGFDVTAAAYPTEPKMTNGSELDRYYASGDALAQATHNPDMLPPEDQDRHTKFHDVPVANDDAEIERLVAEGMAQSGLAEHLVRRSVMESRARG